ncbi:MAG: fructose-6-phosphate aldolase [Nitrospirae bacterium]|nr:fructose-6-phosphate aldolase [Nitrospirota bacterium]
MKFFLDTAVVDEIREGVSYGLVDGVTTNPSLIAKSGRDFREVIAEICTLVDGPISAEVVSTDAEGMLSEGRALAKIHDNIVVKVPMIAEGLKATRRFAAEGIKTNVTLIFSPSQALLAAKAGASFVSPFVGRLDDISHVGMGLVEEILDIFGNYDIDAEVIVASIRNPLHVVDAARMGAHIGTMPLGVMKQLMRHPLTDIGLQQFLKDWESVPKR